MYVGAACGRRQEVVTTIGRRTSGRLNAGTRSGVARQTRICRADSLCENGTGARMFLHPDRSASSKAQSALLTRLGGSTARTRYTFALLVVCVSAALAWLLSAPNRVHSPLLLLAGVAVCGACAGVGPAIVASVLNTLTVCYLAARVHQHAD